MTALVEMKRAEHVLAWVNTCQANREITGSELKAYTKRLPAMIRMNGFGQAIAFYTAKAQGNTGAASYQAVLGLISDWLCGPATANQPARIYTAANRPLIEHVVAGNQERYRMAEAETAALIRWAKKFVDAFIEGEADAD